MWPRLWSRRQLVGKGEVQSSLQVLPLTIPSILCDCHLERSTSPQDTAIPSQGLAHTLDPHSCLLQTHLGMGTLYPFAHGLLPGQHLEGHTAICGAGQVHAQALPIPSHPAPALPAPLVFGIQGAGLTLWPSSHSQVAYQSICVSGHSKWLRSEDVTQNWPTRVHPGICARANGEDTALIVLG